MAEQKTIKVDPKVHERLRQRGTKGETFNEIIEGLLDSTGETESETEASQ